MAFWAMFGKKRFNHAAETQANLIVLFLSFLLSLVFCAEDLGDSSICDRLLLEFYFVSVRAQAS